ncbi:MAG: hypothetical protein ACI8PW_001364, partial [Methylophilaceae bacterium]
MILVLKNELNFMSVGYKVLAVGYIQQLHEVPNTAPTPHAQTSPE